jgi:hypothetical protein
MQGAETAALEYGEGAFVVDIGALTYEPMAQVVKDGELVFYGVSGWNAGRLDASANMIEGIRNGSVAIVHAFIARGADVNHRGEGGGSPLHWAAARGLVDIAELLLAHGARVNARDDDGETPLDIARKRGHGEMVVLLAGGAGEEGKGGGA